MASVSEVSEDGLEYWLSMSILYNLLCSITALDVYRWEAMRVIYIFWH